jgi:WD40 repeat protein
MKLDFWIDTSRLQSLILQANRILSESKRAFPTGHKNSMPEDAIGKFQGGKQVLDAFIAEQAQKGVLPENPLSALKEAWKETSSKRIESWNFLNKATWPLQYAFLRNVNYWDVHSGFIQSTDVAIPDPDYLRSGSDSRLPKPLYVKDLTAVAAGGYHCLALGQNGAVYGWGENGRGQTAPDSYRVINELEALKAQAEEGKSPQLLYTPLEHSGETDLIDLAWSPDGRCLAYSICTKKGGTVIISDSTSGEIRHSFKDEEAVMNIYWSPESTELACCNYSTTKIWDALFGELIHSIKGGPCGAWSPDGTRFAVCGKGKKTIEVLNASTVQILSKLKGYPTDIKRLAWSPDGGLLAGGSTNEKTIMIWEAPVIAPDSDQKPPGSGLTGWISNVVGSGSDQESDQDERRLVCTLQAHETNELVWSPDGQYLASRGHDDDQVIIWKRNQGENLHKLKGIVEDTVGAIAWSPNSKQIATRQGEWVFIWDIASEEIIEKVRASDEPLNPEKIREVALAWHPDGNQLAFESIVGAAHNVTVYTPQVDTAENKAPISEGSKIPHLKLKGCKHVRQVAWSPDGKKIASGENGHDGSAMAKVWDPKPLENFISTPDSINATAIAAGDWHGLALKDDGSVVGWGYNNHGQAASPENLQSTKETDKESETSLAALAIDQKRQRVTALAAGGYHSLALMKNGTITGWGCNTHGQASPPEGLNGVVAIAAGTLHSLALLENGTVIGWGHNNLNQATPRKTWRGVVAIAAGESHSLALLSNGFVVGWGSNFENQSQPPAGLQGVTAIAAGGYHSLALLSNGTMVGWGNNDYGQATPPPISNATAISAGKNHNVALKEDGDTVVWGQDLALTNLPSKTPPNISPIGHNAQLNHSLNSFLQLNSNDPKNVELIKSAESKPERELADQLAKLFSRRLSLNGDSDLTPEWLNQLRGEIKELWANSIKEQKAFRLKDWNDCIQNMPTETLEMLGIKPDENVWNNLNEHEHILEIQNLGDGEGAINKQLDAQLKEIFNRLDIARNTTQLHERQAKKMGAVAFILVNQAMWNFDGISPDEYQLILDMTKDWDRRLGMKLREADHINLVQWAINKWNEDAQNQNHDNYQAIVGNLPLFNRFERPIVPAQLHKVGDLDGGITAEQLQFIHDIETYLNTEGLVAEEDETRMNTDQAICYILLVMALWDDDGFTQEEQEAVAEIMGNFSVGLPLETLTAMLEESVERYQHDDANKDIEHLENCLEQATSQLGDMWKQWLIESLQHLAEVGGTTDIQQKRFMEALPKQLGLEKEPEKAATHPDFALAPAAQQ